MNVAPTRHDAADEPLAGLWRVYRQDDNGQVFEVARVLRRDAALDLVAHFESHGHKQLYWVAR